MPDIAIPARPYAYALPPGRCALVLIDLQRDFVEPGGFGAALGNDVSLSAPQSSRHARCCRPGARAAGP